MNRQDSANGIVALLPRLRRFAIGLCGSVDEGDDLVQAGCLRALEKAEQWRPGSRLDSWLFRIIHTLWLDRLKSARRREIGVDPEVLSLAPDPRGVDAADARLDLERVRKAVMVLPDDQRAVLLLVTVDGQSYQAAAEILQIPIGTVMSRLARARLALAKRLKSGLPERV